MVLPNGEVVVAVPNESAFLFTISFPLILCRAAFEAATGRAEVTTAVVPPPSGGTGDEEVLPQEVTCPLCKSLFRDAVLIPCCGGSMCDECTLIRKRMWFGFAGFGLSTFGVPPLCATTTYHGHLSCSPCPERRSCLSIFLLRFGCNIKLKFLPGRRGVSPGRLFPFPGDLLFLCLRR